jgi:hypothetical protein
LLFVLCRPWNAEIPARLHLSGRKTAAGAKRHKKEETALARQTILPRLMNITFITLAKPKRMDQLYEL